MQTRFRLIRRHQIFYLVDKHTGKRISLATRDPEQADEILRVRNRASLQPLLNLQIAKAYLVASDSGAAHRTWQHVMDEARFTKAGETAERWERAANDEAFDLIRNRLVLETKPEHLLAVLRKGGVATNVFLRRFHNFALDMRWLLEPIINRKQWPKVKFKDERAITAQEHARIIDIEWDLERKAFYQLLWHLGGSQSDVALLRTENIDWQNKTLSYSRKKTGSVAAISFLSRIEKILCSLPASGFLFPRLAAMREQHRASEFKRRCKRLRIEGVTLHSYRYAWAERAKTCGYPERFAQEALGHNSSAVHRAYAKGAKMKLPSLEEYEKKIVPMQAVAAVAS